MRSIPLVAVVAVTLALAAGAAAATSPFKCSLNSGRAGCARTNSIQVARQYLSRTENLGYLWQGMIDCRAASKTLKVWRCRVASADPKLPAGTAGVLVTWRASANGWSVRSVLYQ